MEYSVVRTYNGAEYCVVEANSEEEAINIAKQLDEERWEKNPNDAFIDKYEYYAEVED